MTRLVIVGLALALAACTSPTAPQTAPRAHLTDQGFKPVAPPPHVSIR